MTPQDRLALCRALRRIGAVEQSIRRLDATVKTLQALLRLSPAALRGVAIYVPK